MYKKQMNELVRKKCFDSKYHNSLKYMIHNCGDVEVRNRILKRVFYHNPYLGAQIYMSMCDDSPSTIKGINRTLLRVETYAKSPIKMSRLLMCYLEMGRIDEFYSYYSKTESQLSRRLYMFMVGHLSYVQILYLLDAMVSSGKLQNSSECMKSLLQKYSSEYDEFLLKIICKLFEGGNYSRCWKLINATRKAKNIGTMLGQDLTNQYIDIILRGAFNNVYQYNLYLSLKYGYSGYDDNKEVIASVIEDNNAIQCKGCLLFYIRLLRKYELTPGQQKLVLSKMGLVREVVDICIAQGALSSVIHLAQINISELSKLKADPILLEAQLLKSLNTMMYPFSSLESMPFRGAEYIEDKSVAYELFHQYMDEETDVNRIVFYYFNSLYRYIVNLEYVVTYLEERFSLSEQELRHLFKDYVLYGKISKINENSVSIRIKNVLTARACRLSLKKNHLFRNGVSVQPRINDALYFKFDYLVKDGPKLNVYKPTFTIERMYETEKQKNLERDNENANRRKHENSNQ